jgi:hypothetical protein
MSGGVLALLDASMKYYQGVVLTIGIPPWPDETGPRLIQFFEAEFPGITVKLETSPLTQPEITELSFPGRAQLKTCGENGAKAFLARAAEILSAFEA